MNYYLALILGVACAGVGGELFVRGAVGLARWLRVSTGVIAATVVAFATSSPELSVAVSSAAAGNPQIGLGNALGGNVLNVALILGLALTLGGMRTTRREIRRNLIVAFLVPVLIGLLVIDGRLSRIDGFILLAVFLAWITLVTIEARSQRAVVVAGTETGRQRWLVAVEAAAGLALLVLAGRLLVQGASGIAAALGLSSFVIATVVVAIGTSVPELATTVVSKARGHDEVSLGTILGSNIFNGLFIVAVAAIITPITVPPLELMPAILIGVATTAMTIPSERGTIDRWRGLVLLGLYFLYVLWMLYS